MDPFQDEPQGAGKGFDPMALVRAFWRRKWLFIIPFVLCLSMAAVAIKIMTPVYFAAGQIQLVIHRSDSRLLNDPSRRYGRPRDVDRRAVAEMEMLLTSPEFLEKVVRELELHLALRQVQMAEEGRSISEETAVRRAVGRLRAKVRIETEGRHLFRLGVRDTDPEQAYNLAVYLIDRFLDDYRESQLAFGTTTLDFLEEQLSTYRQNLSDAEAALTEFQAGMASASLIDNRINARNLALVEDNLTHLRARFRGQDAAELAQLEQSVRSLLGRLPDIRDYENDPAIAALVREMVDLATDREVMLPGNREADDLETRLGQRRVRVNNRIEEKVALNYPSLGFMDRNQIVHYIYFSIYRKAGQGIVDDLSRQVQEFREFTVQQPHQSTRLTELQDAVTRAHSQVATMESEISRQSLNLQASASEIGFQLKVRQRPVRPRSPIEPDKFKLAIMGFVLSLGIGTGLVILALLLDRSFTTVEDIERTLGLTVIGTLPVIQDDYFERKRKLRLLRWVTIILGVIAVGAVGFLVIYPRLS